jgi:hypothetical protein
MEQMMKANLASAFDTASGGASGDVMAAIREMDAKITSRLDELAERMDAVEGEGANPKPSRKPVKR